MTEIPSTNIPGFDAGIFTNTNITKNLEVLVADDNALNQKVVFLMLNSLGYQAGLAANGIEVLQAIRRRRYDLIFMDVEMPVMNGLELTRAINREFTAENRPYIVAMTANALRGDREICLEAGVNDYLSKPVRKDELRKILEIVGERKSAAVWADRLFHDAPSFDMKMLESVYDVAMDDWHAVITDLVNIFAANALPRFRKLCRAVELNNEAEMRLLTHGLKGSSATIGAVRLADLCRLAEGRIREGKLAAAAALIPEIEAEIKTVLRIFEADDFRRNLRR